MILCATTSVSRIRRGNMIVPDVSLAMKMAETVVDFLRTPGAVVEDKDVAVAEVMILGVTIYHRVIQTHERPVVSLVMMWLIVVNSRTP